MYKFSTACIRGDENEVKRLYEQNPAFLNQRNTFGRTGQMSSVSRQHHAVSHWLLGRPGLDTTASTAVEADTALHLACLRGAPAPLDLDIVAQLAELSRWQGSLNSLCGSDLLL